MTDTEILDLVLEELDEYYAVDGIHLRHSPLGNRLHMLELIGQIKDARTKESDPTTADASVPYPGA